MPEFVQRSTLGASPAEVFAWHAREGALERLLPPWQDVNVIERAPALADGTRVVLEIRRGPFRVRWVARHRDVVPGHGFVDEQESGPFRSWAHTHRFLPSEGGGTQLVDEVVYRPPGGALGGLLVRRDIERMFRFRHRRTTLDLMRHARFADRPPLRVAVSGATGLVGTQLAAFLSTGGHEVRPLVRRAPRAGEIAYDPVAGTLDPAALSGVDAIVHLGGESIAAGRWTSARKRAILESRVRSTELLARAAAAASPRPRVFVCASAIGWYDQRGPDPVDEAAPAGHGFLADVCRAWEGATRAAEDAGIRVVHLRIGIVLAARGGALAKMLLPFRLGLGGRVGSGRQGMSWIALDDLVGAVHHVLMDESLRGPVNATAPAPVSNAEFTRTLAGVLNRPAFVPVPALALRLALGEMADALLLAGPRVRPARLQAAGAWFLHAELAEALRFELGG